MTKDKNRLLHLATRASVITAMTLIAAKLFAWLVTDSVSIMASLIDSLMDAGASLVNLFAVRYSMEPPDDEHRFGHGKAEALAGLGQSAFIVGSAIFLLLHALNRLIYPQPLADLGVGMAVIVFAMAATLILLAIQKHVIRQTNSVAIRADSLHYVTDLLTNTATLGALLLAQYGFTGMDPLFAIGIAGYILYSAGQIARHALRQLMDSELPPQERETILRIAASTPRVLGVHGLRTWQSGQRKVIQLHLALDDDLPLKQAHGIAILVESRLRAQDPELDVIIHQDPASLGDESKWEPAQNESLSGNREAARDAC
jgi:ferrous-iron efflux pump FieF